MNNFRKFSVFAAIAFAFAFAFATQAEIPPLMPIPSPLTPPNGGGGGGGGTITGGGTADFAAWWTGPTAIGNAPPSDGTVYIKWGPLPSYPAFNGVLMNPGVDLSYEFEGYGVFDQVEEQENYFKDVLGPATGVANMATLYSESAIHRLMLSNNNGPMYVVVTTGESETFTSTAWTFSNDMAVTLGGGVNGLSFDGTTFSVDATNHRIGIGTATANVELQVASADAGGVNPVAGFGNTTTTGYGGIGVNGDGAGGGLRVGGSLSAHTFLSNSDANVVWLAAFASATSLDIGSDANIPIIFGNRNNAADLTGHERFRIAVDGSLLVSTTTAFAGNITQINSVTTSWPAVQGGANTVLTNNGAGTLSWAAAATGTIGGSIAVNQVAVGSAANTISGSAQATFDGTTYTIAPTTHTGDTLVITGGALASTKVALNVTGTLSTAAANQVGESHTITSAGSAANTQTGISVSLAAGYTGSASATGFSVSTAAAGTNTGSVTGYGGAGSGGNYGIATVNTVVSTGDLVGVFGGVAGSSGLNIGGMFFANNSTNTPAVNVGVIGRGGNATTKLGAYFDISASLSAITYQTAALVIDNNAVAADIFVARDNGTAVVTIADGGATTFASHIITSTTNASNAGTGTCTAVTVTGRDNNFGIAATCTAGQTVVVNFGLTWGATPVCIVGASDANAKAGNATDAQTTTQFTLTSTNNTTGAANWHVICLG